MEVEASEKIRLARSQAARRRWGDARVGRKVLFVLLLEFMNEVIDEPVGQPRAVGG